MSEARPPAELAALDGPADRIVGAALALHGPGEEAAAEAIACAYQDAAAEWAAGYDPWEEVSR